MDANMRGISRKHDAETCTIANYTMHTRQESVMIYALKVFPYFFFFPCPFVFVGR
jgi:hypothetical protein